MEIFYNFKVLFLSVWNKGILGVDIFQILIGIGIFLIFLIFRGIISKVIIKKLDNIAKRTSNKLDDTFVQAMEGPARFLPIVLGFFIESYYMTRSELRVTTKTNTRLKQKTKKNSHCQDVCPGGVSYVFVGVRGWTRTGYDIPA